MGWDGSSNEHHASIVTAVRQDGHRNIDSFAPSTPFPPPTLQNDLSQRWSGKVASKN